MNLFTLAGEVFVFSFYRRNKFLFNKVEEATHISFWAYNCVISVFWNRY